MTSHTEREILSTPQVWATTLADLDLAEVRAVFTDGVSDVVVTGCGSTHYLAMSAAALLRAAGLRAWAVPASELLAGLPVPDAGTSVLLAISRSGTTTETVRAVEQARRHGVRRVAAVTCDPGSVLALQADHGWHAPAAAEQSVAQTRSFASMQLIAQALAAAVAGADPSPLHRLPDLAGALLERARPAMAELARDPDLATYFFLGQGPLFGIASEAMLKLKEMSLTSSEAYHTLEFRHGPMSMCEPEVAVLGLLDPDRATWELPVYADLAALGARIVTIGPGGDHPVPGDLPAWARPVLHLLPLQLLALERALHKGLDPDAPRHLTAVIHLDQTSESTQLGGRP